MAKDKNGQPILPGLQNIQDQSTAFNRLRGEYERNGKVTKRLDPNARVGDFQRSDGKWIKADSSQVDDAGVDKQRFDSTMDAHGIIGKQQLYDKFPKPKLQDSVFAKLTPQSVMEMPQTKLNGRVVCTAGKGCVVEQPFNMDGKTMAKHGHEGKAFTQMNEAGYLAQTGNPGDKEKLQNSWNAGNQVMPELEKMTAQGDTAQVRSMLGKMQGFQQNGNLFKTEMRRDTIPEQAQYVGQQEMNDMRSQGLDVSSYKGYANKDEARKTAMYNPVREKAFSAFEQKLQNSLKKKP